MVAAKQPARLLERERELASLRRAWLEARDGRGSAWLLCAEAGGGKTRLARELARGVDATLLWGAAEPVSPPEPYLAICRALADFEPAPARAASIARAVALLDEQAAAAPVLFVLDDLHFADEGTIAVLVRLCALSAERRWLILGTLRPGEGSAALRTAATELVAQGAAERLDLPPLSRTAVAELVAAVRGTPSAAGNADIDSIYADTGGNPWFVEAVARGSGAMSAARDRILLRLDRLESAVPGAVALLGAMAPAAHPLPYAVLSGLVGGDSGGLRRMLAGLRDAGVLREHEDRDGWEFRHELLRRALLDVMIAADRRDAHRALAEALLQREAGAAELAMHFAAAGDARAVEWAMRAASEAFAVDAHVEALAQFRRALSFPLEPELRRQVLRRASIEAFRLGQFAEAQRLAEEAIAVPGGEPETLSLLHQRAANAARLHGDMLAAGAHMDAAEQILEERPASYQKANVAVARMLQYTVRVEPEQAAAAGARALALARELDPAPAERVQVEVRFYQVLNLAARGDPAAFQLFEALLHAVGDAAAASHDLVIARINTYIEAVLALFHREAAELREGLLAGIRRHELGWESWAEPHHVLELIQRGRYVEAEALAATIAPPKPGSLEYSTLVYATVLREVRAGSPERARALLAEVPPVDAFKHRALMDLAAIELAATEDRERLAAIASRAYERSERRQYARVAGIAAVALALAGQAPPAPPSWLSDESPLLVFWQWAAALAAGDRAALLAAAKQLSAMDCPYESALALRDAGALAESYRALNALEAGPVRRLVAQQLRAAEQPVPRRSRSAIERDPLTETERVVCRLVAAGESNTAIAEQLGISVRTVESHMARIYQKSGQRGRVALAAWWRERESG